MELKQASTPKAYFDLYALVVSRCAVRPLHQIGVLSLAKSAYTYVCTSRSTFHGRYTNPGNLPGNPSVSGDAAAPRTVAD